jgi:hypothetical protein
LDKAFADPNLSAYLVKDQIDGFRGTGGVMKSGINGDNFTKVLKVRIEDDIIIWAAGNENMNADLPRTVEEIEQFMAKNNPNCASNKMNGC